MVLLRGKNKFLCHRCNKPFVRDINHINVCRPCYRNNHYSRNKEKYKRVVT